MMKKQVTMYGIVVLSIMAAVVLSGCGQSQSTPEPATAVDTPSAPQTAGTAVSQPPASEERVQKQLQFAETYMASAKKGLIPYAQPVKICRDIIRDNPGTNYETYARQLLKEVPADQRDRYKITDEELGL